MTSDERPDPRRHLHRFALGLVVIAGVLLLLSVLFITNQARDRLDNPASNQQAGPGS